MLAWARSTPVTDPAALRASLPPIFVIAAIAAGSSAATVSGFAGPESVALVAALAVASLDSP